MKQKHAATIVLIAIVVGAAIFLVKFSSVMYALVPREGELTETWYSHDSPFRVKIDKYPEVGGLVPGANYVFSSFDADSNSWIKIMTFRHDDPIAIPTDSFRYTNDRIATVRMGWRYAVTIDGGKSWKVSSISRSDCIYKCIQEMVVNEDGTGSARLNVVATEDKTIELRTDDFGKNWF